MKKQLNDRSSLRTNVCTLAGGVIVIGALAFSRYAGSPACTIPGIKHPAGGMLVCAVLLFAVWLVMWGWKNDGQPKSKQPARKVAARARMGEGQAQMWFYMDEVPAIRSAEEAVFALYQTALKPYAQEFAKYGALMTTFIARIGDAANYKAYVACVLKDTDGRIIESKDHDMYMDFAWPLSVYSDGQVLMFGGVDSDLFDHMQSCERYFADPY